jgi:phage gpG-like protein
MPAVLQSRIPEIIGAAEVKAELAVAKTCMGIEADAKRNLVANGSVVTGNLVGSIESHVTGTSGEVGTNVEYSVFVEYGTGQRGSESEFEGKPDDITYSPGWAGMSARPYLSPAAEANRGPFLVEMSGIYG